MHVNSDIQVYRGNSKCGYIIHHRLVENQMNKKTEHEMDNEG